MRAIDGAALKDRLQNLAYNDWNQGVVTSWADAFSEVADMVEDMPTIEPEIIRCKNCKHFQNGHICQYFSRYGTIEMKPEDFCSYAERR